MLCVCVQTMPTTPDSLLQLLTSIDPSIFTTAAADSWLEGVLVVWLIHITVKLEKLNKNIETFYTETLDKCKNDIKSLVEHKTKSYCLTPEEARKFLHYHDTCIKDKASIHTT